MDPPHLLLGALEESITSGTFIDTKFFVFSRRDGLGRVGSPRPLYCNSRVLNTVPYFSALFSNGFSEGEMKDIDEGFPPGLPPYSEFYDYLSDSDLEDDEPNEPRSGRGSDLRVTPDNVPEDPPQPVQDASGAENHNRPDNSFVRAGKIAVIHDMAAVTFEAMIYFLYTGEIAFAPLSSDPRNGLRPEERTGDWKVSRIPSPSAKSMYRLADKYDIPTLKEQAKAHILTSLADCNIVDELFSSFSSYFPEMVPAQILKLVGTMESESKGGTEGDTMKRLLDKIASLSQLQLERSRDVLSMIWNGIVGQHPDLPAHKSLFTLPSNHTSLPNWRRVKLAILKSISTGIFVDIQLYAHNAICNNLSLDAKPLFTSSIVIEAWGSAISTHFAGADSRAVCLADGLIDDYERWHGDLSEALRKGEADLEYRTEAVAAAKGGQAVLLVSGAWKTWMSLFSYAYTHKINFTPLQTSTRETGLVVQVKAQPKPHCSPRSMYSLSTALGIENIKRGALNDIRSKLTTSNVVQELFTLFAANHKEVMDMEINFFLKNFTRENPELLMDHIQRMSSGEADFFPSTLSSLYGKLAKNNFPRSVTSGSVLREFTETDLAFQLACSRCTERARLRHLFDGLRCPRCPPMGWGRPFMQCPLCKTPRTRPSNTCLRPTCPMKFV